MSNLTGANAFRQRLQPIEAIFDLFVGRTVFPGEDNNVAAFSGCITLFAKKVFEILSQKIFARPFFVLGFVSGIHIQFGIFGKSTHTCDDMLVINPETCIDCDACVPECPVEAVFSEANVPAEWTSFTPLNADRALSGLPTISARLDPLCE